MIQLCITNKFIAVVLIWIILLLEIINKTAVYLATKFHFLVAVVAFIPCIFYLFFQVVDPCSYGSFDDYWESEKQITWLWFNRSSEIRK